MNLYINNEKVKLHLNNNIYRINLSSANPIINYQNYLLSLDNYILTDSNGLYLIPKDISETI
jgi:hypothetical protein